jgi:hypothetical protein
LQPGDFVELVWETWKRSGEGPVTSFWRVVQLQDDETSDNSVQLTLEEDQFATARDGEITDFTIPIVSVDVDVPLDDGDFGLINYAAGGAIGSIEPVLVDEPSIWVTKGERRVAVGVARASGALQSISVGWAETPFSTYNSIGITASFPITGTLDGALGVTGKIIRNTRSGDHFDLALTNAGDETELLAAAGKVGDENDSFSLLTADFSAIMIVGTEVIRVGLIEEDAPGVYTVKNAIRGEFGTEIQSHLTGSNFFFFPSFIYDLHTLPASTLPIDVTAKARVQGFTGRASSDPVIIDGPDANTWSGRSVKPLPFSLYSATRAGFVWTIKVRPRIHTGGANFGPNLESEFQAREPNLGDLVARVTASTGDSVLLSSFGASLGDTDGDLVVTGAEYVPSDGTDPTTGLITFTLTFTTNPASVDLFPVLNGRDGDALNVLQPA